MEQTERKLKRRDWMELLETLEASIVVRDEKELGFAEEDCMEEVIIRAE